MIVVMSVVILTLFLGVGWAVSTEMFQHRAWRKKVGSGDTAIVRALIEEALGTWSRARPPKGTAANLWAGVQGCQRDGTLGGKAVEVADRVARILPALVQQTEPGATLVLDEAIAVAAKLADMMLYDVPNLRLASVRVDVYSTFTGSDGSPEQRPILSTTATRAAGDGLDWEALTPAEVLGRFQTVFDRGSSGQAQRIELPPVEGSLPELPLLAVAAEGVSE